MPELGAGSTLVNNFLLSSKLTKVDEWFPNDVSFVLDDRHLSVRIDLLDKPVWFHLQVYIYLFKRNSFSICNQSSPLQTKQESVKKSSLSSGKKDDPVMKLEA